MPCGANAAVGHGIRRGPYVMLRPSTRWKDDLRRSRTRSLVGAVRGGTGGPVCEELDWNVEAVRHATGEPWLRGPLGEAIPLIVICRCAVARRVVAP